MHVACDEQQTERHLVESGLDQIEQLFKKPNAQENKACSFFFFFTQDHIWRSAITIVFEVAY